MTANGGPAIHAYAFEAGRPRAAAWAEARAMASAPSPWAPGAWVWTHLDRGDAAARDWLAREAGLGADARDALTRDDTRPRAAALDGGVLLVLRGLNRDAARPFQEPVSVRLFVDAHRVISLRLRPFSATYEIDRRLADGARFETPGDFVGALIETTLGQIEDLLDTVDERFDKLEELALAEPSGRLRVRRRELNELTRGAIVFRRHLRPQSDAFAGLADLAPDWLTRAESQGLREAASQTARIVEDLEEMRERAGLIGDEMQARLNDRMNRTLVTLAIVSTVFLPMTVLTGLFGVNLAGIPYADQDWAFSALVGALLAAGGAMGFVVARLNRP